MTSEVHLEIIRLAAELVRGLHKDIVFSETTPWYVRDRVNKVIEEADNRAREIAVSLRIAADKLSTHMTTSRVCTCFYMGPKGDTRPGHDADCPARDSDKATGSDL